MVQDSRSRKPLQRNTGGRRHAVTNYVAETALVKSDAPNTTFGYNSDSHTLYVDKAIVRHYIIYKWAKVAQVTDYPSLNARRLISVGGSTGAIILSTTDPDELEAITWIEIHAINEDFDASAITWNSLAGLSTSAIFGIATPVWKTIGLASSAKSLQGGPGLWDGIVRPLAFPDSMYGIYLVLGGGSGHSNWSANVTLANDVTGAFPQAYFSLTDRTLLY